MYDQFSSKLSRAAAHFYSNFHPMIELRVFGVNIHWPSQHPRECVQEATHSGFDL